MHGIGYYISAMLPYMIAAVIPAVVVRIIGTRRLRRKGLKSGICHETGLIIYIIFITGLFSQTILANIHTIQFGQGHSLINLIPGKIIYDSIRLWHYGNRLYFVISLLGNIIMFMPFGFFTPLLWRDKNVKDSLIAGFLASLTVEICQLPQPWRTSDVDDLILNTLGALLGYVMYLLMKRVFPAFTDKFHVKRIPL